jgi:pilus assembly protein CpaE
MQRAGRDRRLSRACLTVRMGGVDAALDDYARDAAPDLVVIESIHEPSALLRGITRLVQLSNDVPDGLSKVIVIGHVNDAPLCRELFRRGVSDYLVAPASLNMIVESMAGLCIDPSERPLGQTIAFIGARGGVGSSAVCHNVAWSIASGLRGDTVIADFDLAFGTTGLDFNREPAKGLLEALAASDRLDHRKLDRLLAKCADHLSLLASPASLDRDCDVDAAAADRVMDALRQSHPYVVLDIPHHWSPAVRRLAVAVDDVVITAEPDLTSLRNAKSLVDLLRASRADDRSLHLVLNKVNTPNRPEIGAHEFANALGVEPIAIIEFDAQVFGAAANNGLMIEEVARKSEAAASFRVLAGVITGTAQRKPATHGLFGQILNRFSRSRTSPPVPAKHATSTGL